MVGLESAVCSEIRAKTVGIKSYSYTRRIKQKFIRIV
jgi:hypothetical protein